MAVSSLTPEQLQALLNGPAAAPPPGVIPQLDDPPNLHTTAIAVQMVCIVLTTLALLMRLYTRIWLIRQTSMADYAIILGWAVFVGYFVPSWFLSSTAAAVHQWNLRLKYLEPFLKYVHVGSIMYGVCIFFIKLSILLQYLQIFAPPRKSHYMWWSCWTLIAANFVFYFVSSFVEIFSCRPIAKAWNPFITEGSCINVFVLNIAASSINTLSDIIILVLPQVTIWNLQMSRSHRLGASAVFFLGIFACAASAVRLGYAVKLYSSSDLTYYTWYAGVWTYPEMACGIIVACLPVFLRFLKSIAESQLVTRVNDSLRSLVGRRSSSSASYQQDSNDRRLSTSRGSFHSKDMWSRAYADLESSQVSRSMSSKPDVSDSHEGVYVMHSIDMNASIADESIEGGNTHNPSTTWNKVPVRRSQR